MLKIGRKGGLIWAILANTPMAACACAIGRVIHLDSAIIVGIQLPALVLQMFGIFMWVRYGK